ncbi:hypothetical protein [Pontibacillus salipaludis]|uniref:Uncharacterized protein n=1 Tax=Pontibacillus salipaludis TaxID=1697394 RepID=A0ABQ1PRX7_9BACI|nr:hypothetical protein [Pontibacillus salipaludis]GGD02297.1 hypothetical protein GCM10011389_07170 [Pontibacillus salipaludis]
MSFRKFLFEDFQKQKEMGGLKSFDELTKEELKEIFYHELISDSRIAELFDVGKRTVTNRRYKLGLKENRLKYTEGWSKRVLDEKIKS